MTNNQPTPPGISQEAVVEALLAHSFTVAKTATRNPHAYTLRKNWADQDLFEAVVEWIREHGVHVMFWRKPYVLFRHGGYRYWTMGAPVGETTLINRAIDADADAVSRS